MKTIFKILKRDLINIIKNPSVFIVILGFCVLPSLYAWINIKASWNPYAEINTRRLPIAVINNDSGSTFNNKNINIGNEVVKELKKNTTLDWVFIDEWQGNYGLNTGKYYALIEIPQDFSSKMLTVTTQSPEKPNIIYRSNEKLNAVATKITDSAKTNLINKIKSNFIKTASQEVFKELNSLGKDLETDKPQIIQLKDTIPETVSSINDIKKYISEINTSSEELQKYLNTQKSDFPKLLQQINSVQNILAQSKLLVLSTKQTLNSTQNNLNNDINEIQSLNNQIQDLLTNLNNINKINIGSDLNITVINQLINLDNSLIKKINNTLDILDFINDFLPNKGASELIDSLNILKNSVQTEKTYLNRLKSLINSNSSEDNITSVINELSNLSNQISMNVVSVSNAFYLDTYQSIDIATDNLTNSLNNIDFILESTKVLVPQLNTLANSEILSSKASVSQTDNLNKKLEDIQSKLNELSSKMENLNEENLNEIIDFMEKNPDELSNLLSSPINIKNVEVYNSGLFGYAVTPFYTTLAIWVGVLLLSSILSFHCKDFDDNKKLTVTHKYFGKLVLFLILSFIQTIITILGDVYLIKVYPQSMGLMILISLACSITFTIIIYTLASILGNIGKAIAVIIMVFQIAGAGGIYPIETLPKIFSTLAPFWPFTYAIRGFREAIGGPLWKDVYKDLIAMAGFSCVFLLLSLLKRPLHNLIEISEHKFRESGL
ncbi:YhgE/Pip domain-containing protein [Clostridium kluyveri]|uniref:Phage infection protein n=1 Tax=Clostridium kluyveri TaxID=1534 RepID=A0A1L5F7U2_CLOKL|nr:YhgE/Pip domain-containing protein [Clostridium kluyveri]APM39042.1 phage infection protein [Clostridium kluyveri]UZQ51368.1 YhgE/Pip domain-containing protein [Clostridium kluyveri]